MREAAKRAAVTHPALKKLGIDILYLKRIQQYIIM